MVGARARTRAMVGVGRAGWIGRGKLISRIWSVYPLYLLEGTCALGACR